MPRAADSPAYVLLRTSLADALRGLRARRLSDESVHAARKALRKARAALRLLRPGMDDADYRVENIALRDAARFLSPLRDAKSLLAAFDALTTRHATDLSTTRLAPLKRLLRARRTQARHALIDNRAPLRLCLNLVDACSKRTQRPDLAGLKTDVLADALGQIYRKGRKAFGQAQKTPGAENLHEWRKQVKFVHAASMTLADAGTPHLGKIAKRARKVAALLGDDHDLYALRTALFDAGNDDPASQTLKSLLGQRRIKLQARAIACGRKLFEEKPARLTARLRKDLHELD
jgi:CHAD domain-containing protein